MAARKPLPALSMIGGPQAALAVLASLERNGSLVGYPCLPASKVGFQGRLARPPPPPSRSHRGLPRCPHSDEQRRRASLLTWRIAARGNSELIEGAFCVQATLRLVHA